MSFLEKIERHIEDMKRELAKTRAARVDKSFHSSFVSDKINKTIKDGANINPENPVKTLGNALSSVAATIEESFDYIEKIESNIMVTINAYTKIKEEYISWENEEKIKASLSGSVDASSREIRKIGERPEDKMVSRRKTEKSKTPVKKKTTARKKSEKKKQKD